MKSKKTAALDLAKSCCRVLDEKKAENLSVLDVSEQSSITDYLVIATATSAPHLRALRIELGRMRGNGFLWCGRWRNFSGRYDRRGDCF